MKTRCAVRHIGAIVVLDLRWKITIGDGDILLRAAIEALLSSGAMYILLNLRRVRYMDAAGVGQLVDCHNQAAARGATVKLVNPTGRVYDLLTLTKLSDVFEVYRDEKSALASFAPAPGRRAA